MARKIITRSQWKARHDNGCDSAPVPADEVWLHHSVTQAPDLDWIDENKDGVEDDEGRAMRTLEDIGENRFGCGISYTWPIMPSGRIYEGHGPNRQGTHTGGRNDRARAIVFVGNYETHRPTRAQLESAAWLLQYAKAKGWIRYAKLNGGHRDLKSTACPGKYAYAAVKEINLLAGGPPIGEDTEDMAGVLDFLKHEFRDFKLVRGGKTITRTHRQAVAAALNAEAAAKENGDAIVKIAAAVSANGAAIKALAEQHEQITGLPELVRDLDAAVDALNDLPLATALVLKDEDTADPA